MLSPELLDYLYRIEQVGRSVSKFEDLGFIVLSFSLLSLLLVFAFDERRKKIVFLVVCLLVALAGVSLVAFSHSESRFKYLCEKYKVNYCDTATYLYKVEGRGFAEDFYLKCIEEGRR